MATQFEILSDKLDNILHRLTSLEDIMADMSALIEFGPGYEYRFKKGSEDLDLEAEANTELTNELTAELRNQTGEDYSPGVRRRMNRHEVEVRAYNGGYVMYPWSDIDPRVIQAVELSVTHNMPYELYEDGSGRVRIQVDNEIAHLVRKANTPQMPVPSEGAGPPIAALEGEVE